MTSEEFKEQILSEPHGFPKLAVDQQPDPLHVSGLDAGIPTSG